jgi:hypothetical protein
MYSVLYTTNKRQNVVRSLRLITMQSAFTSKTYSAYSQRVWHEMPAECNYLQCHRRIWRFLATPGIHNIPGGQLHGAGCLISCTVEFLPSLLALAPADNKTKVKYLKIDAIGQRHFSFCEQQHDLMILGHKTKF